MAARRLISSAPVESLRAVRSPHAGGASRVTAPAPLGNPPPTITRRVRRSWRQVPLPLPTPGEGSA